jgi:hypothetical protein
MISRFRQVAVVGRIWLRQQNILSVRPITIMQRLNAITVSAFGVVKVFEPTWLRQQNILSLLPIRIKPRSNSSIVDAFSLGTMSTLATDQNYAKVQFIRSI